MTDLGGGLLDRLSDDLLLEIVDLTHLKTLSKLIRTSKRLHQRLNSYLYRSGMKRDGRPLVYACKKYGREDIITRVLSHHESPEERTAILTHRFRYDYNCQARKKTPLTLAMRNYNLPVVRMLVNSGANVEQPEISTGPVLTRTSMQPIHIALARTLQSQVQFDMLELLIQAGVDVNSRPRSHPGFPTYTPLMRAVVNQSDSRFICLLLASGANPTEVCPNITLEPGRLITGSYSPFSLFLQLHEDFTDDLYKSAVAFVQAAATPDTANSMLLECLRPHEDERWVNLVDVLLKAGANPRMTNDDGDPCLVHFIKQHLVWSPKWDFRANYATTHEVSVRHDRVRKVSVRIIQLFAEAGVTVNYSDENSNRRTTPWMVAAALQPDFEDLFIDILHMGADGHARDANGATAFHTMFVHPGHPQKERIATLVAIGCPINAKDSDGNTLLHMAALSGMVAESWLPELIKYRFDPLAKNRAGQTFVEILCFKPATPFEPERYDHRLDASLRQQIEDLTQALPKPRMPSKPPLNKKSKSQSNKQLRPRNRGKKASQEPAEK
ncbi:ankyrin [Apiospora marii]|uniref:Ankyrin n=1 Tax=Apiospora marii TaxID=335849 RepID=A0ABR1R0H7_9PEZI